MTTVAYDIGDLRRIPVAFTDIAGAPADPTSVTFKITEPDGTTTSYLYLTDAELVRDSLGNFHVDWPFVKPGRHAVEWAGSGLVQAVGITEIWARRRQVVG
jgi:hypothetical protein